MRRSLVALGLALAFVAVPATAHAGDHVHTLAAGETLAGVARAYYGESWKSVYLTARNALPFDKEAPVGTKLIVPASFLYRVKRGDSLGSIAKKFLGADERYKAVMQENGIKAAADLEPNRDLLLPFHIKHTVATGESLATIARRYFRSSKRVAFIQEYNDLGGEPKVGDKLIIPIFDRATLEPEKRHPAPPAAAKASPPTALQSSKDAKAKPQPTPGTPAAGAARVASAPPASGAGATPRLSLGKAVDLYRQGEYQQACEALEALLDERTLSPGERTVLVSHLGFCAVAQGDRQAARDYFSKWLELDPKAHLDPITTSPKILALFAEEQEAGKPGGEAAADGP